MSRQAPRWLNGLYFNETKSDAQKKYFAGDLTFHADEESINKFCDQLKAMASMYREIDERYLRIKITRNSEPDAKTEFSFERDDWDKSGEKKEKVKRWMDGGEQPAPSEPPSGLKTDPDESFDDEGDLPF